MTTSRDILCPKWRNLIITSLFCLLVALTTYTVWGGPWYVHVFTSLGFGYSALLSSLFLEHCFPNIPRLMEITISLTSSVLLGSLNAWLWLDGYLGESLNDLLPVVMLGVIFSGMCFYYFYNREQQAIAGQLLEETKRKQAEQEKALILSQLMQMQSQIEPHFLFNTLANISALMSQDVTKARMMLDKLTELLRTTLANSRLAETTVNDEIRQLSAYLAIQKVRLDERLNFTINVDDKLTYALIPPMLIQPLVENAIKHGIEPKGAGGTIDVSLSQHQQQLKIQVKDDGIGLNQSTDTKGHGVGLSNIKQRIKGLYEQLGSVVITQPQCGGFCVTISIPMSQSLNNKETQLT
ncbi:histidine kinase [Vibrio scophthalmi]|uniref:Autolysin sensor kinase n=2 Tax=Vibrio scophthalmi TaxID=45658 RepID=F9RML2_9VIBR|nr:histidine kinase [Vibrio scophthalmi]ANU36737.1 Sensor protein LytS [Vibrio scophthalmi]EGU38328.1 autolysin sensor kinase [Vibrio scophthalmi LMG 19158]